MMFFVILISRSPAIILTLSIEMIVGVAISNYEKTLRIHILLTSFMPVLSSVSGNIGLQASTATLRALATGHASHKSVPDILKVISKELGSAFIISCCAGILLSLIAGSWSKSLSFALVTGLSILISSTLGGLIGCLSPIIFKNLSIDPAYILFNCFIDDNSITAGPFETGIQDIIGISLYLSLAYALL